MHGIVADLNKGSVRGIEGVNKVYGYWKWCTCTLPLKGFKMRSYVYGFVSNLYRGFIRGI